MKLKLLILGCLLAMAGLVVNDIISTIANMPTTYITQLQPTSSSTRSANSSTNTTPSSSNTSTGVTTASASSDVTQNWAGYMSTGGTYTTISGNWTVPSVTPTDDPLAADATWIGIGGDTSQDLIQVGTENMVEDGTVTGATFYEELPDAAQTIQTIAVNSGDQVSASINETSSGEWTITIQDLTNGESYTDTVAYDSSESSAEWIEEAPSDQSSIMPLDDFGAVVFTGATTTENGSLVSLAGSNAKMVGLVNDADQSLATVSAVTGDGEDFTVTRTTATDDETEGQGFSEFTQGFSGSGGFGQEPGENEYSGFGSNYRRQYERHESGDYNASWQMTIPY